MPSTAIAEQLHAEKYRAPGESFREWANRVAAALKDDDSHFHALRAILLDQRFLPGGRIQAAAGSPRRITAFNCFVMPTLEDSFTDGDNSIMDVAKKAAQTMRMGGGVGYDFSTLRPRGTLISSLGSRSSGPVSFMEIFDAVCRATASAGNRRGAQMAVLRVDHPDIEEFVRAKQNANRLTGFNVSIAVTNEFMVAARAGGAFQLRWGGRNFGTIDARSLWEQIMRSTWDWAEPGVLFVDTINTMNNLHYCEQIAATNPCGEQPLPPNGACLLGSFNLTRYLTPDAPRSIDVAQLARDVRPVLRAMDNVIDRTCYPLFDQEVEAKMKRRVGIGVTGLANAIEALGCPYGSAAFLDLTARVLSTLRDELYLASAALAEEKGAFPYFDTDCYLDGRFARELPDTVRDAIARSGLRNSHLTSIAPTGTISLCADNVSSGIEPTYAHSVNRTVLHEDGPQVHVVRDWLVETTGIRGRVAAECSLDDHLGVLETAQRYVDSAVSKTVNVDPTTPWDVFKRIYERAWEAGCKGITTFNPSGKRMGILVAEDGPACKIDPETGARSCES